MHNLAFQTFVSIQSDAALREVAGKYAYDDENDNEHLLTLRSGGEEINEQLEHKLNERLAMAGMEVVEARINYLAYAPEIAAVMLRRQQASAIITAREKIVEGAVTMVKLALDRLEKEEVVKLDNDRKAAMIGNLLVIHITCLLNSFVTALLQYFRRILRCHRIIPKPADIFLDFLCHCCGKDSCIRSGIGGQFLLIKFLRNPKRLIRTNLKKLGTVVLQLRQII